MENASAATPAGGFPLTRWSLIQRARTANASERRKALDELARAYWWPLYCFVLRSGVVPEDAMDLVQGFFLLLLEKDLLRVFDPARGRFRTFLLACIKGHWSHERERMTAEKRGGRVRLLSLAEPAGGPALDVAADALSPDLAFERAWAMCKMDQAIARVREDLHRRQEPGAALVLDRYLHSANPRRPGYEELAAETGLSSTVIRHLLERIRGAIRSTLLAELREETGSETEALDELEWIVGRLARK
ncbi:MAG: sigma-70 family RNA polymerase sigma factor [Planctomycetes bacterium]|nr:sigma-70 family RNA polymerase sigma factor [Planctomycetota bacterium]